MSVKGFLIRSIRRRARTSVVCCIALFVIGFTFMHESKGSYSDNLLEAAGNFSDQQYLSFYLERNMPWSKAMPKPEDTRFAGHAGDHSVLDIDLNRPPSPGEPQVDFRADNNNGRVQVLGHDWNINGLLNVNSNGAHPIYELVNRAEANWQEKLRRASKTLKQAVNEYERRYGRPPPLGFDHWWNYVQQHNVRLPDEYDQISRDLEPYWGIDPSQLRKAQLGRESYRDSFTIGKDNIASPALVLNYSLPENMAEQFLTWGAYPQLDLMSGLWQYVPPFRATFSPHDAPNQRVDWTWKAAALAAAKGGTYLRPEDLPPREKSGWASMCTPGSPLYESPAPVGSWPTPQEVKTFIHDHLATMDVCQHPQTLLQHGIFLSQGIVDFQPERFPTPQLSNSATSLHADIRSVSAYMADDFAWDDPKWEEKDDDRLVWRGGPTGMRLREEPGVNWRGAQRLRFVNLTAGPTGIDDVVRYLHPGVSPREPVGEPRERARGAMNRAMMDVGFAANYDGCAGVVCDILASELGRRPRMSQEEAGKYKYVFDVDGNGWSARFRRLMSMHSVVFKATIFPEWFSERVQPWVHYVPVQIDYSDLYDSLAFFAGDAVGDGAHDKMAQKIGEAGREWVLDYWRKEDMVAYMFRLWLEYARVMSVDRNDMHFVLPQEQ